MPNTFAYIILIIWPVISIILYKRLPIVNATFWTIVGGFLLLPERVAIDFPILPALDKETIPAIAALIGCLIIKKNKMSLLPKQGIERWMVLALLISPFLTMINNQESYRFIAGITLYDSMSSALGRYLMILPFIIGMQLVKTKDDELMLFKLIVIAGLLYSLPMLYEIRMSPQLHTIFYGFFPHSFSQQIRYDGFRPVVFLRHGLVVAMFTAIVLGASAIIWKEKIKCLKLSPTIICIYLLILLFLCKTVSGFVLGTTLFITISFLPISIIKKFSVFLVVIFIFYPLLLALDIFPREFLVDLASDFDPVRGGSLDFRFMHERLLLEHGLEKMFFGWGGWGRNRLENSVTDGSWMIVFGKMGLVGFVSLFGLFVMSVLSSAKASALIKDNNEKRLLVAHALIVSIMIIDQLPNSSLNSWMFLYAGALVGRSNYIKLKYKLR